ncbi:hypothetical protein AQJ54_39330 [Streptomyces griseorubiginosus]|uniref:histidine kinase n=1 Tax=Streptomyces griseorubiginosus TaxID=67304 RepID=A0A124HVU0_9ACTN|nr:hypothetical protein AQJ54_39330 [Streptomyces griseorubiginosus]
MGAVTAVVRLARHSAQQRTRISALEAACSARDSALDALVSKGLPALAASTGRPDASVPGIGVAGDLARTAFAENLQAVVKQYAAALRTVRSEAEEATRLQIEERAQEATQAAVRSVTASVVSLGADLSKVVGEALRQHDGSDEMFATLTRIDHTVQQIVRQAQSYVVICGGLPGRRWPVQKLTDIVRGALGRIPDYPRIKSRELDRAVTARAVEPVVHALATLLDNAARYSPPTSYVDVTFQEGHRGVTVVIDDAGVSMSEEQLAKARQTLSGDGRVELHKLGPHPQIGFHTVAALAHRYGFTASVGASSPYGGVRATLFLPDELLTAAPEPEESRMEVAHSPVHELDATKSGLPKRRRRESNAEPAARPALSSFPARAGVAAAWRRGTSSGRASVTESEQKKGSDHQ